jgi:GntR family transcriptional regulator
MQLYVNAGDELPLYRQIMRQITDAIAGARLRPGERLPSHRELALQLVIAPLTVKKAYDELEREGLIVMQHGRGTFVCETVPAPAAARSRERLREAAQRLLSQASLARVPFGAVVDLLEEMQKGMEP